MTDCATEAGIDGVPSAARADLPSGTLVVGRYRLAEPLGSGGHGVVYAARDEMLERRVALKLVARGVDSDQLLAEGRAMAKLRHAHVVQLHDVLIWNQYLVFVMELLTGGTLSFDEPSRDLRAAMRLLLEAGSGLVAAHAAGLVHLDFKPANVLVDDAGHARVADFGIARAAQHSMRVRVGPALTVDDHTAPTVRGAPDAICGTPEYMSPEQLRGEPVDARSDQFSFCVAVVKVITGKSPWPGARAVTRESLSTPRLDEVPAPLRPVLLRGLAPRVDARYPTMVALLSALESAARRARLVPQNTGRWRMLGGLAALALIAALAWVVIDRDAAEPPCLAARNELDRVWNAARRDAVTARISIEHREAWDRATVVLDRQAERWIAARLEVCEAAQGTQEPAESYARLVCLTQRRDEIGALLDALESNARDAGRVTDVANALSAVGDCNDLAALRAVETFPTAPGARARVSAARQRIAQAKVAFDGGRWTEAAEHADAAVAMARATAHRPTLAGALYEQGRTAVVRGDPALLERALLEAIDLAEASRDDLTLAQAWVVLPMVVVMSGANDRLPAWERRARATLARIGNPPRLVGALENILGVVADRSGRSEIARDHWLRALHALRSAPEQDVFHLGLVLSNLGADALRGAHPSTGIGFLRDSIELITNALGPRHPNLTLPRAGLAYLAYLAGNYPDAKRQCSALLEFVARVGTPDPDNVVDLELECADIERAAGDPTTALARLDAIATARSPTHAVSRAIYRARALRDGDRWDAALAADQGALARCAELVDDAGARCRTDAAAGLAESLFHLGRLGDARSAARAAYDACAHLAPSEVQRRYAALVALIAPAPESELARWLGEAATLEASAEISAELRARGTRVACGRAMALGRRGSAFELLGRCR